MANGNKPVTRDDLAGLFAALAPNNANMHMPLTADRVRFAFDQLRANWDAADAGKPTSWIPTR